MAPNTPLSITGCNAAKANGSIERTAARTLVGAVTVGQAPRRDVTSDIAPLLGSSIELIEAGALDELDAKGIAALAPRNGESVLASLLRSGESVLVSERKAMPLVQQAIDRVVAQGAQAVILLCTATDPLAFSCGVPVVHPSVALAEHVRAAAVNDARIAVIVPDQAQVADTDAHWRRILEGPVDLYAASPYGPREPRLAVAEEIARTDTSLIVLDCIGYSVEMAREIERVSGKPTVVPRVVAAETVSATLSNPTALADLEASADPQSPAIADPTVRCLHDLSRPTNPIIQQPDNAAADVSRETSVRS